MLRYLIIAFFLFPLTVAASDCHKGEEGARKLYAEEWGKTTEVLADFEVDILAAGKVKLYRVIDPVSCGYRGCEFSLFAVGANECLVSSFSAPGRPLADDHLDWSSINYSAPTLPVDGEASTQSYRLNMKTLKYEKAGK